MSSQNPEEKWAIDCADLPMRCKDTAKAASDQLRGSVQTDAQNLLSQGFIVPSLESLTHASVVFANISSLKGGDYWLQRPNPIESLHLVNALATSLDGLEREWDLSALSSWWIWRAGSKGVIEQANGLRAMLNAGKFERALELLKADIVRAEREYVSRR